MALSRATFADTLRIAAARFVASKPWRMDRTEAGEMLGASAGAMLWRGEVTLVPAYHADAYEVEAVLALILESGAAFEMYDPRYAGPRADPGGALISVAPTLAATQPASLRGLALEGLPAGYVLSRGDMLSFGYGSPARRALHRVVTGGTASSGGALSVDVVPARRAGVAGGEAVELVTPFCLARLDPESLAYGSATKLITEGASFAFVQTLQDDPA